MLNQLLADERTNVRVVVNVLETDGQVVLRASDVRRTARA